MNVVERLEADELFFRITRKLLIEGTDVDKFPLLQDIDSDTDIGDDIFREAGKILSSRSYAFL